MKYLYFLFFILVLFGLILGCSKPSEIEPPNLINPDDSIQVINPVNLEDLPQEINAEFKCSMDSVECVVLANNEFAFDMYDELISHEENMFFSPWSITTALAMTYEGANGKTKEEMANVLKMVEPKHRLPGFASIIDSVNTKSQDYKLSTVNALWAQESYQFLPSYFELVETVYGGKVTNLDFVSETEKSRITINDWVEDNTNNKIKDLIPNGILGPTTALVLTNAVYFKGTWVIEFDKKNTYEAKFDAAQGMVNVDMMKRTDEDAKFKYFEDSKVQMIELPYEGDRLSMFVILPKDKTEDVEINNYKFNQWQSSMENKRVKLYLPKFKFEQKKMLKEIFIGMGMVESFSSLADFSLMTGKKDLFISQVIHQAYIDVNEEGTEAAAATAVVMNFKSAPDDSTPVFNANHPFTFIIKDQLSGSILFMGEVVNPSE